MPDPPDRHPPDRRSLTVLGCDGSFPGPGGAASGYLVQAGRTTVWLDAGSGTFANLQRWCELDLIDAVICSHEHPDHWCDVELLAVAAKRLRSRGPVPVYAPDGVRRRSYHAEDPTLEWHALEDEAIVPIGELRCRFACTDHGPPTMAARLEHEGAVLGYSADCGPDWSFSALGQGVGVALCEATYTARDEGTFQHLSGRQAGAMARAAGVARLVVTHRWPTVSADDLSREAAEAFGAPVEQAVIGQRLGW